MKKNTFVLICSIIVGVCAAVAATLIVLKLIKKKKDKLECTDYVFENDFEDETEEEVAEQTEE